MRNKENTINDMKETIEDLKKKIFKSHGYIDDQTVSLEEHIKELKDHRKNLKECLKYDKKITNQKMKLKFVMQRKVQKTMDFFCINQNLFNKYYDTLTKINNHGMFNIIF
jgi:site-specific DNA-adenine methylase